MKFSRLLLATTALVAVASPAHAEPVTLAIFGAAFAASIPGQIVSLALIGALNFGVSLVQQALNKPDDTRPAGTTVNIQVGDDQPISAVMGRGATAGKRKYAGSWGNGGKTPNAYLVDVVEIGSLPCAGLEALWVGDQKATILWDEPNENNVGYPIEEYRRDGKDHLWIKFYDGTQTAADDYLLDKFGDHPDRPYESGMIGRGCPYAILTCRYAPSLFTGGAPSWLFEPGSILFYDLRKDSTNGGTGAHRWSDKSTWEPSDNNAVIIYNIIRGIHFLDEWMYGGQNLAAFRLPPSNWIAGANACDAAIALSGGGTEKAFRGGYEFRGDERPIVAIDKLRKACNARVAEVGGSFKILVGAPGAAVYAFSDEDIIVTEGQSLTPFPTLAETINGIEATYPEPAERWAAKDAPALYSDVLEAEDGNRRLAEGVTFDAAPFGNQVQRLMKAMIQDERRFRTHQFYLPPDAYALEPNDVVAWTSVRNGYSNKKFLVTSIVGVRTFNQLVTLREIDPADYDWDTDFELPTTYGWLGDIKAPLQPMTGWAVEPDTVPDATGTARRPAVRISCASDLDDVKNVHVQTRVKATEAVVFDSDATAYAYPYTWLISGNWTLPATEYEARGKYIPYSNRETEWSDWLSVITPDVRISTDDLTQDILDKLDELQEWIDEDLLNKVNQTIIDLTAAVEQIDQEEQDRIDGAIEASVRFRALLDEIESIRDYVANADYAGYTAREEIRRTITARLEDSIASFDERITTAVSETAAISERLTTFDAEVGVLGAQIITVDTARVDGDTALAQQIALLSVGTDNQFDPAKLWSFDSTVEGWTGNGTPTVSGGFLRPANHASDPYVTSPVDLAITADAYSQVRARVRKTGTLTWDGRAWWRQVSDATWDTGRSATVSEPSFDGNGIGLITFNMAWSGTIDRIRLDLSTVQDASNYYTIDWISIGSPSPGASRAELIAERTARIDGDGALASDIVALEAEITDPVTGLTALAGGVTALESEVSTLGDTVSAHSTALTGINTALDGKASVEAVTTLEAEVEALGGGGIVSQGQAVTAIRNELLPLASEIVDQEFANFLSKMDGLKVTAEASNSLDTKITLTAESLDILSQAVTRVQAVIPGLATATVVTALTARVTATESTLTSQASSITSINASLPLKANTTDVDSALATKASASGLTALTGRVTQTEDDIESQADAITSINTTIGTKASVSAVNALTTRVTATEDDIEAQGDLISSLTTTVGTKASVTALNALTTRVTTTEDDIATKASATSVTALSATVGDIMADARFKMEVVTGPSGYARIAARVRYGTSGSYRTAGWYTDVPSDTGEDTLFVVEADRFAFVDGSSRKIPFRIDNGTVFIDDLQVTSSNIEEGAVAAAEITENTANITVTATAGAYTTLADVVVDHGTGSPKISLDISAQFFQNQSTAMDIELYNVTTSTVLRQIDFDINGNSYYTPFNYSTLFRPSNGTSSTTFRLRARVSSGTTTGFAKFRMIRALVLKKAG